MTHKRSVTAYALTFNEARQIRAMLETVKWADEIIVVDSFSTDGTAEIAHEFNARVISEKFCGFGKLRNFALDVAQHDWIFSIDADERCTRELATEIRRELAAPRFDAYHVPRKSHFFEALAAGLPVVTSAYNGAAEVVQEGMTDNVVKEFWRPEVVAQPFRGWIERPRRVEVEAAAFSLERNVSETLAVIESAAKEKAR